MDQVFGFASFDFCSTWLLPSHTPSWIYGIAILSIFAPISLRIPQFAKNTQKHAYMSISGYQGSSAIWEYWKQHADRCWVAQKCRLCIETTTHREITTVVQVNSTLTLLYSLHCLSKVNTETSRNGNRSCNDSLPTMLHGGQSCILHHIHAHPFVLYIPHIRQWGQR
jgi:hypothetical protein